MSKYCNFNCLKYCPFPKGLCQYDDPDYPILTPLTEYESYRKLHNITKERPTNGNSCPRCFSKRIKISFPYIRCHTCKLEEELIDFPVSKLYLENISIIYSTKKKNEAN